MPERYFTCNDLVAKCQHLLDMITWSTEVPEGTIFVKATVDRQNPGILNDNGTEQPTPHNIYVDGNLIADIGRRMPLHWQQQLQKFLRSWEHQQNTFDNAQWCWISDAS